MPKNIYEKPTSRNLSAINLAQGTCWSGAAEYTVKNPCLSGEQAIQSCNPSGGIVLPTVDCRNGASAGFSCVNGAVAG